MEQRVHKIIINQQNSYVRKDEEENIIWVVDPADLRISYCLVFGLLDEFSRGEYIFRLTLSDSCGRTIDYPTQPPKLGCLTPNGIFQSDGGSICVSVGEFHSNVAAGTFAMKHAHGWRRTLGITGFVKTVVFGIMVDWEHADQAGGIRIISDKSKPAIVKYAADSCRFNTKHNTRAMELVNQFIADHPDLKSVKNLLESRGVISGGSSTADP